jgi:allantoicase
VLPRTRLAADARQVFAVDVGNISALRVQAYPDGGIARVRAVGTPTVDGLDRLRRRWEESS